MSKTISEIYAEYKIMPSLERHMLRMTAVAVLICDNFVEPLPKEEIITSCLLHDMGNIIKSNLSLFPEFLEPQGLAYWQNVKDEYIAKYGPDEHHATLRIMKELGVPDELIRFVDQMRFSLLCKHKDGDDFAVKILTYADNRVDPKGVVSFDERVLEAKRRYKDTSKHSKEEWQILTACGKEIEKQIFSKCKIKPEDINNESVEPVTRELRNFVIK